MQKGKRRGLSEDSLPFTLGRFSGVSPIELVASSQKTMIRIRHRVRAVVRKLVWLTV